MADGTFSRRTVLAGGGALAGVTLVSPPSTVSANGAVQAAPTRPRALQPGDRIWITSPAKHADAERLERGTEVLESWGLEVVLAPHALDRFGYLGGTDADRLADLNAGLADPAVRGVIAALGGYGTQRIVDGIDLAAVARDPKLVVGFSDLTALHLALWSGAGLATVYGPMASWDDERTGPDSAEALRSALMSTDPIVLHRHPGEASAAVQVDGQATGMLLGGNLSLLTSTLGSGDFPDLHGAILFIEDVGEAPYRIDRNLTSLLRSGGLGGLAGVAIGQFTDCEGPAGTWTAADVLADRLGTLGVPILGGLPIGHDIGQLSLPLGVPATLDTQSATLTVEPAATA